MKSFFYFAFFIVLFSSCTQPTKTEPENFYKNPVIAGDIPDPSIIRVENDYYAVGTSCDFAPNYPIYHSTDLVNWTRISSVFSEPPAWTSDDFWAPEMSYRNGTFYVYYTTKRRDNRIACIGVATTTDIRKGFTDHGIIIEWGEEAIDAFVFQDDEGKLYISWKAYGLTEGRDIEILASELSADGLSLVGEHFTLTDFATGWQGAGDEGQCIVKRNGFYYMFYSIGGCCDNRCDYRVMVARSKNLRSGWEQFPDPILQGSETWKCTGHGTLVSTPDNRDFYMYHSYNATDFEYIGRQGMLDEIFWDKTTGWPYFENGIPSDSAKMPFSKTRQNRDSIWFDDFSTQTNLAFFEWDALVPAPQAEIANGLLNITSNHNGISFLGLRPKDGDYILTAEVMVSNQSGIGIYSNQNTSLSLTIEKSGLVLTKVINGEKEILTQEIIPESGAVYLRYEALKGRYFHFFWSENGEDWIPVKVGENYQVDGSYLAQWGFSPRVGFILNGEKGSTATFSELKVKYINFN
ncbi:MAG: family 43 glycosylhydrolase [Draconibacterium sp.]|nr:family 43 glycosylhydrolase [Draconibacterium sp.]